MIKLEFDGQDPTALKHLGQALVNMANEMNGVSVERKYKAEQFIEQCETFKPSPDDEVKQLPEYLEKIITESNPKYDANGLPWDERIHSGSKARNKDDTWKKRKGVDDATVAAVTEELEALMSIPVVEQTFTTESVTIDMNDETISKERHDELCGQPLDGEPETDAPPPPPPVLEQVSNPKSEAISQDAPPPPPPEVTSVADAGNTQGDAEASVKFVDITKFITGTIVKNGVKSMPEVTAAITAEYGVPFPALAKREDLWPQVMAFLEKMNNEADTK